MINFLLSFIILCGASLCVAQAPQTLPTAPKGYKWVKNTNFSDEFDTESLDKEKWYDRSPYWQHGRPPATFRESSVSVKDGYLQIKNSILRNDPKYNIAGGAVASVANNAHYGYYECRMKASSISMSSTFWLKNLPVKEQDGARTRQELDIVEVVGMQKTGHDFRNVLHSNTHYQYIDKDGIKDSKSVGGNCPIIPAANESFHTYGCWWKDATTLDFYLDGEYQFTIHPSQTYSKTPFNRPMYMHLVTETYNWESPPTEEELNNDAINTTYYDWVRSYKLVPVKKASEGLTKPNKSYRDTVDFSHSPNRLNDKYPLSDQNNSKQWKFLKNYSDEFKGKKLNTEKWYSNNPKWKGRQPTYFHESNVNLEKGQLVLRLNQHLDDALPKGYTHTAGFIKSKKKLHYGYIEAQLKPMNASWVTGFWMTNAGKEWWTEIDICENCPGVVENRHDLNSNLHVFRAPKDKGDVKEHFSRSAKYYIPFELQNDYHVWGLEWDEEYIRFYIDGVLFREAENTHWHQPLEINFNNESNKWFGALPNNDQVEETYQVEYLRVWQKREKVLKP